MSVCLGYLTQGGRCGVPIEEGTQLCEYHDPKNHVHSKRLVSRYETIKSTTCDFVSDNDVVCNSKGLCGLNKCYLHYSGEMKVCANCSKTKKTRILPCGHEFCVSCFVASSKCPAVNCFVDPTANLPREFKTIPERDMEIIGSILLTMNGVPEPHRKKRLDREIQLIMRKTLNAFCPCCESDDPPGHLNSLAPGA